jgi:ribosomal protein L39E
MQEPYSEGVAIHTGPESCGHLRKDVPEALTVLHAGRVLSRASSYIMVRSADAVENVGRRYWRGRHRKASSSSARSETPCTHGSFLRRNWEIPCLALTEDGNKVRTTNPQGVR